MGFLEEEGRESTATEGKLKNYSPGREEVGDTRTDRYLQLASGDGGN